MGNVEKLREKNKKKSYEQIKDFKVSPVDSDQSLVTLSKKVNEVKGDVDKFMNENTYTEDMIQKQTLRVTRT